MSTLPERKQRPGRSQQDFAAHTLGRHPLPPPGSGLLDLGCDKSRAAPSGPRSSLLRGQGQGEPVRPSEAGSAPPGPRAPGLGQRAQDDGLQGARSSWLRRSSARIIGKIPTSLGGRRQEGGRREEGLVCGGPELTGGLFWRQDTAHTPCQAGGKGGKEDGREGVGIRARMFPRLRARAGPCSLHRPGHRARAWH